MMHDCLESEYRREVFRWAAGIVQKEFSTIAWQSFWLTAIEGLSVEVVARKLDRSVGSIYSNRSRIMRRLRQLGEGLVTVLDEPQAGEAM